ncbi:MAG: hypothetical protein RR145_05620, partial [Oscillospiraceae bacterium]
TLNVGMIDFEKGYFTIDMRLPQFNQVEKVKSRLLKIAEENEFRLEVEHSFEYTHIPPEDTFMKDLGEAFEYATGKKAEYLGSCGLTYSKVLGGKGVAYGGVFDESGIEAGGLHSNDEYFSRKSFLDLAIIYAKTIYKLWC